MAFYYDQRQEIFNLRDGHSVVLDQKNSEALLIKLATEGFDHTFLLINNYVLGETQIDLDNLTMEGFNKGDFVVAVVTDTTLTDLDKLLFHYDSDTAINILKNLTNPNPIIATEQQCRTLVERFAPVAMRIKSEIPQKH